MSRRHGVAVAVAVAAMVASLVPALWVRATGDEVTLAISPVDPLSLFRGNYVDLRYDVPLPPEVEIEHDVAVYAVFADGRPGTLRRVSTDRPALGDDEWCLRGRVEGRDVAFPNLEQFFVTATQGRELERDLSSMLAVLRVTEGCRGVLVDLVVAGSGDAGAAVPSRP